MEWVLITGANSSIGFSIAKYLAPSFNLILAVRDEEKFQSKKEELLSLNKNCLVWSCDFEQNNISDSLKVFLQNNNLVIHHFICLSGFFSITPIRLLKPEIVEKSYRLNVQSALEISSLIAQKKYREHIKNILYISSISTIRGNAGYSLYASAKSALHGLAKSLSVEIAPTKVNTIILGPVKTEATQFILKEKEDYLNNHLPLGLASDDVLNHWIEFLLTKDTWMTGQEIIIDGGATVL